MKSEPKILVLLFISYVTLLVAVIGFSGYNGLYGQDSHEYLRYCNQLIAFLKNGADPGNYFWTVAYPLTGAFLSFLIGSKLAMLLIPVLSAAWILVLVTSYLMNEFPGREREVSIYSFLFLGLSPYFFRYSISIMSDIPATAFLVTAWYFADRFIKVRKVKFFYFTIFSVAFAVFFRVSLAALTVPVFVFIGLSLFYNFNIKKFILASVLIAIPVAIHFYFKGHEGIGFLNNILLQNWSFPNYFSKNFSTVDGISQYTLPNILFIFSSFIHPGFLFPGLFFVLIMWYNKNQPSFLFKPLVFGILLYSFFLCGIPFQNTRFMVPVLPLFLIICFPSYLTVLSWFHYRRKLFYLFIFIVVSIQSFLVYRALLPFYKVNVVEKEITAMVLKHEPKSIYTFGLDGALRSYGFTGELINLYDHPLDSVVNGSFLVFNKSAYEKQWKGRNPMINFEFILKSEQVKLIDTFTGGWELYEIHEKYRLVNPGVSRIN